MGTVYEVDTGKVRGNALKVGQLILTSIGVSAFISVAVWGVLEIEKLQTSHANLKLAHWAQEAEKGCLNGGVWDEQTGSCTGCEYKSFGKYCDQYYEDCHDYWNKAIAEQDGDDIEVLIKPQTSEERFAVICRKSYGGQTIFGTRTRRVNNLVDSFNRGWYDYKKGFGDVGNEDFFIGLENLHNLLKVRDGRLKVFYHQVGSSTSYHANYWQFRIDGEQNKYALHFESFSNKNDAENGFEFGNANETIRDAPFCTPDRDCNNCAALSRSGWWFNTGCAKVNLHSPDWVAGYLQWPIDGSMSDLEFYEMIIYFEY